MSLAPLATPSHPIPSISHTPSQTTTLPGSNFPTVLSPPAGMAQPNMAANWAQSFSSEFLSPELGLVFPQEYPSAYLQVQVGAFEPQPPGPQEFAQCMVPSISPEQISAGSLDEKRFTLGLNFPETLGPPAALQLTAPPGPSELHEPSQGELVPRINEGNFMLTPTERSCSPGVPPWFWESNNSLGIEYAP